MNTKNLLTPDDVAKLLGVSKDSLARWRMNGDGPPFVKLLIGRRQGLVRYRPEDVQDFVDACLCSSTSAVTEARA